MPIEAVPFSTVDWSRVPVAECPAETGRARWRTIKVGNVRVRMVEHPPGCRLTTGVRAVTSCRLCKAS